MATTGSAHEPIPESAERAAAQLIEAAFRVHRALGPGLLESVYERCLCHELTSMGVPFERQVDVPVTYEGIQLDGGLRLDLLVDSQVVCELKAVMEISDVHRAQLLTYMKLSGGRLGFVINFNVARVRDGLVRMVL